MGGSEEDISDVLQIDNIFTNVSKGLVANKLELGNSFPGQSRDEIIKTILSRGEVQMAELERGVASESIVKDIANIIAEKTLNTKNFTRFPVTVIIKAMETIHYAVKADETAKKQALVVIKLLTKVLPMRRIRMRIALAYLSTHEEK